MKHFPPKSIPYVKEFLPWADDWISFLGLSPSPESEERIMELVSVEHPEWEIKSVFFSSRSSWNDICSVCRSFCSLTLSNPFSCSDCVSKSKQLRQSIEDEAAKEKSEKDRLAKQKKKTYSARSKSKSRQGTGEYLNSDFMELSRSKESKVDIFVKALD